MNAPEARAALNAIIFRTAVERPDAASAGPPLRVFCECPREVCDRTVTLTPEQYLAVLVEPGRRVVAPEHWVASDRVVHDRQEHLVVRIERG
jgi:hypothetical protein